MGTNVDSLEPNFLRHYGHLPLNKLTSNWQQVNLSPEDQAWANLPPKDFLEFVRLYPRLDFDGIPESPNHLKPPTFLISQAHRIWVTTSLVHEQMLRRNARSFLDVGSFPFFNALVLRDYFDFKGEITVTTNIDLSEFGARFLGSKNISIAKLDLDPFVNDPAEHNARLPASLNAKDEAFDVVLSSHVIEHLYHPATMLHECQRVLSLNGCMVVATDNAMMVDVLANYISGYGYIFEPIESTAAMNFNFWRGHVRFFTSRDLRVLLEKAQCKLEEVRYFQCFYEILFDDYFRNAQPLCPGWKKQVISELPWLRNELCVIATKSVATCT